MRAITGPAYALVRPEFTARRSAALARHDTPVRRALIAFGLTDVGGITDTALQHILPLAGAVALDAIVGAAAPSLSALREMAARGAISLHIDTQNMPGLCAEADIAVGAGGSSLWERAVLGLPSIVLSLADNQIAMTRALAQAGVIIESELNGLRAAWARLMADADLRAQLSRDSAALCDGQGAQRVAAAMLD